MYCSHVLKTVASPDHVMLHWFVFLVDLGDDRVIWSPGSACCLTGKVGLVDIGWMMLLLNLFGWWSISCHSSEDTLHSLAGMPSLL